MYRWHLAAVVVGCILHAVWRRRRHNDKRVLEVAHAQANLRREQVCCETVEERSRESQIMHAEHSDLSAHAPEQNTREITPALCSVVRVCAHTCCVLRSAIARTRARRTHGAKVGAPSSFISSGIIMSHVAGHRRKRRECAVSVSHCTTTHKLVVQIIADRFD